MSDFFILNPVFLQLLAVVYWKKEIIRITGQAPDMADLIANAISNESTPRYRVFRSQTDAIECMICSAKVHHRSVYVVLDYWVYPDP